MKRLIIAAAALLALGACTDPEKATRALDNLGMTDIEVTGYRYFGCDNSENSSDTFHTGFTAKNAKGKPVSGVVCSGWMKGATVRFD